MDNVTPLHRGIAPPVDYDTRVNLYDELSAREREALAGYRERRIDYAYMVAGALCAVAGLGLARLAGVL